MAQNLLSKLGSVKAIISFILILTYAILNIIGRPINEDFVCMLLMIIGFYFGSEHERKG